MTQNPVLTRPLDKKNGAIMSERRVALPARQARIEYLRARAAYEREALSFHTSQLGRELSPKRWLGRVLHTGRFSANGEHSGIAGLIGRGVSLANQYPYLTATISSLFMGKRLRWLKWVGVGVAVWQAVAVTRSHAQQTDSDAESEPDGPY